MLPPAATIAQLVSAFANTKGGAIVLGVVESGKEILINGLSDEFRAVQITRKAIDLSRHRHAVNTTTSSIRASDSSSSRCRSRRGSLARRQGLRPDRRPYRRSSRPPRSNRSPSPALNGCSKALAEDRKACTEARAKLLDHYESVLRILDDLCQAPLSEGSSVPTDNAEGKMLLRILFASCADTFETFMSDLLYEIYLAKPETLKSDAPVTVKEVLDCSDMDEFITWYAKEKLKKLQRGSVKGFIADNGAIKSLSVFDKTRHRGDREDPADPTSLHPPERHRRRQVPAILSRRKVNDEYRMTLDEFLARLEYLAQAIDAVDEAARNDYQLSSYS